MDKTYNPKHENQLSLHLVESQKDTKASSKNMYFLNPSFYLKYYM